MMIEDRKARQTHVGAHATGELVFVAYYGGHAVHLASSLLTVVRQAGQVGRQKLGLQVSIWLYS